MSPVLPSALVVTAAFAMTTGCAIEPFDDDDDELGEGEQEAARSYRNLVLDESGDPFCARFGDAYYLYLPDQIRRDGRAVGGAVLGFRSKNLVDWEPLGRVYDNVDETNGDQRTIGLWAPEVLAHKGKFYLYYVNVMSNPKDPGPGDKDIVVIESDDPTSFHDGRRHRVLLDGDYAFIDPSPFKDPVTDELYLLYKKRGATGTGSQINIRPMSSPIAFSGPSTVLLESEDVPDSLAILEHPMLHRAHGRYWLLFSRGRGDEPSYAIAYATSQRPTGPFTQRGVLFRSSRDLDGKLGDKVIAPGASSIVRDGDGARWLVYRQKKTTAKTFGDRGVAIDPIEIDRDDPVIRGRASKGVARRRPVPLE